MMSKVIDIPDVAKNNDTSPENYSGNALLDFMKRNDLRCGL